MLAIFNCIITRTSGVRESPGGEIGGESIFTKEEEELNLHLEG